MMTAQRFILVSMAILAEIATFSQSLQPPASAVIRRSASVAPTTSTRISRISPMTRSTCNGPPSKSCLFSDRLDDDEPSSTDHGGSDSDEISSRPPRRSRDQNGRGLLAKLNEFGQSFKSKAKNANVDALVESKKTSKILLKAKACFYYMLYMFYRGYRGFFVILPAVFQEVYSKMESTVDFRVLDDDEGDKPAAANATAVKGPLDTNPETGKLRWRTRITVSILAGIVTISYVIGGLVRVVLKFIKTIAKTSSLSGSFSAAAEEVESNENRILRITSTKNNDVNGTNMGSNKNDNGYYP